MSRLALLYCSACVVVLMFSAFRESRNMNLQQIIARFAPTPMKADQSGLSSGDRRALDKLVQAAQVMDTIYLQQQWRGNAELAARLAAATGSEAREVWHSFQINMGPWSDLDGGKAFVPGVPERRPPGANYYPEDMTKEEFETWVKALPESEKEKATGFFYTIRRKPAGGQSSLYPVPYSDEYRNLLTPAAALLREAAGLTDNPTLRSYLEKRAKAFETNDYYESDVAWMELDSPIDITIGPYETYMDELFGYKAAFEAFVCLRDEAETKKLANLSGYLQEIENNLPIDNTYKNPRLGALSPIRVVDEVIVGGEARGGVQTAAFNLPNDEKVVREKGSKRVMLRNVQQAKFEKVLQPIAKLAVAPDQQSRVEFEPFFTHILAHELMHGLGPHDIRVGGRNTTVRLEMKELYSALEEAKADISGLFALQYLIDKGVYPRSMEQSMYVTYLAGIFRSVRFGIGEAHGKGMAVQFNYLVDEKAIERNPKDGTFRVDVQAMKTGVRKLTHDIMTIQAEGSYDKARALFDRYAVIRENMRDALAKFSAIPVDIEPVFSVGEGQQ